MISFTSFPVTCPFLRPATSRLACSHCRPMRFSNQLPSPAVESACSSSHESAILSSESA
jgi:hypothetical protein